MKVSIIIPTKDKHARLKAVLLSLKYQNAAEFETIVVNDGGNDVSSIFEEIGYPYQFVVVDQPNSGRAASRNRGAEQASAETLIFLDDDCMVQPDFIRNKMEMIIINDHVWHGPIRNFTYLKFFEDPFKGILYPEFQQNKAEMLRTQSFTYDDIADFASLLQKAKTRVTKLEKAIHEIFDKRLEKLYWLCCVGGNITISRGLFMDVNGFDEGFGKAWGCEDLEFGYRLQQQGTRFLYDPDNPVFHLDHYRQGSDELLKASFAYFHELHRDQNIVKLLDHFFLNNKRIGDVYPLLD